MEQPNQFTFDFYEYMLSEAQNRGYTVSSFEKYEEANKKTVIVRHDVDYTLNGVLEIVNIENKIGVTSTYLFRVHAHEYNIFAPHVYQLIRYIRDCGHEIGLHLEAMTFARALHLDPRDILKREKAVIEAVLGQEVKTVSEHRDISHFVHGTPNYHDVFDPKEFGFDNYGLEDRYFEQMKYLSDSNGSWREGDLTKHLGQHDRFQVLVHPDWWFEKDLLLKGPYFHGLGNGKFDQ